MAKRHQPHLPVLSLTLQQQRVLGLVNVIGVVLLDALDIGLCLDAVVFGEGALVSLLQKEPSLVMHTNVVNSETYSAGIGQEVRANRLNIAVVCLAQLADGFEVLLTSPALGQDGQWQRNLHVRHCARLVLCGGGGEDGGGREKVGI